jgi:SET domain-containing protein
MTKDLRSRFEVRKSGIDGRGVFATARIPKRRKFGELAGELISQREATKRARSRQRIAIVEFGDGRALDASVGGNAFRFTNHSCTPNAYIRNVGTRVEFYALRDIRRGQEVTCDYGETQHEGTRRCTCGSKRCRSYL